MSTPEEITFQDPEGRHWALRPDGGPGCSAVFDYETGGRVGRIRAASRPHGGMTLYARPEGSTLEAAFTKPADAVGHLIAAASR